MKLNKVLVIDYEVGNHQSVVNALKFLGYDFNVSREKEDILNAEALILPGVGAFGEAMKNLGKMDIIGPLEEQVVIKKKPILGICLGMQILADDSEEMGFHKGLGWIKGNIVRIEGGHEYRVPRVGWSDVTVLKKEPLFERNDHNASFYFDHSYHFVCEDKYVAAKCNYGNELVAAVKKDNIYGVQFHPEKSQTSGLKLFRSFFSHVEGIRKARGSC